MPKAMHTSDAHMLCAGKWKPGGTKIEQLFGETQSSRLQPLSPMCHGRAGRLQQCMLSLNFSECCGTKKTKHFARFTPLNSMLLNPVGCSVPVAFSDDLSFSLPRQHLSILWCLPFPGDPWPFTAVVPKYNQTTVAFTPTENFNVLRSCVYAESHSVKRT